MPDKEDYKLALYHGEGVLEDKYGTWAEHPRYSVADWQYEVANNDTRQSYWGWVCNQILNEEG